MFSNAFINNFLIHPIYTDRKIDEITTYISQYPEWNALMLTIATSLWWDWDDFISSYLFIYYWKQTKNTPIYKSKNDNKLKVCIYTYLTKACLSITQSPHHTFCNLLLSCVAVLFQTLLVVATFAVIPSSVLCSSHQDVDNYFTIV